MHCPAVLFYVTCAFASVTSDGFRPTEPRSIELVQNSPVSLDEFNSIPNNVPLIAPILPISPIPSITSTSPDISSIQQIALPAGWCIPDIIRIPLVPCQKPTQPLSPIVIPIPQPSPLAIPVPLPWPWPQPIPFPDIEPISIPPLVPWQEPIPIPEIVPIPPLNPWPSPPLVPWAEPITIPEIIPIPPLVPWAEPIPIPEIIPIPPLNQWPSPPLVPWPEPIPIPEIVSIPPLNPWSLPPLEPSLEPIPIPEIIPILPLNPWPSPPLVPWPEPIPIPEIVSIPPLNPWSLPPLEPSLEPIPIPEIIPVPPPNPWPSPPLVPWPEPRPFPLIPISPEVPVHPLPGPDSTCEECIDRNPAFVEEYLRALVLVEQAVMDILSRMEILQATDNESTRQYFAILAVWKRLQDDPSGGLTIPTEVYNSIVQETVPLALNDPELVAEIVSSWLKVYLDATVNIRRLINFAEQSRISSGSIRSYISTVVRRNPYLQLEANLLLQLGEVSSGYLALVPTFNRVSDMGCTLQYLYNSKYDVTQLVERFRPATTRLNTLTLK